MYSTGSNIYSPLYDYKVNMDTVNQFLNMIPTQRGEPFYSSQTFNPLNDFLTQDLYYIPCYGAVNNQNYPTMLNNYVQLWNKYLKDTCKKK